MRAKLISCIAAGLLVTSGAASAVTLTGDVTITFRDVFGSLENSETVNIVDGPEVSCGTSGTFCEGLPLYPGESIDLGGTSIAFTFSEEGLLPGGGFYGFIFSGLEFDVPSDITEIGVSFSGLDDFAASSVTFDATSVTVDLQSAIVGANGASLDIVLITTPVTAPIPEPGSIALLGVGLAGLFALRRRSARSRA